MSARVDTIAVNSLLSSAASAEFHDKIVYSTSEDSKTFQVRNSRYNTIKFSDGKELRRLRTLAIPPQVLLLMTEQAMPAWELARYVEIEIVTGKQWGFLDEIVVDPSAPR